MVDLLIFYLDLGNFNFCKVLSGPDFSVRLRSRLRQGFVGQESFGGSHQFFINILDFRDLNFCESLSVSNLTTIFAFGFVF